MRVIKVFIALAALVAGIGGGYYAGQHYGLETMKADAEQVFSDIINQNTDSEQAGACLQLLKEYVPSDEIYEDLVRNLSYEVEDVKVDGMNTVCTVKITNRDMNELYSQYLAQAYQYVVDQACQKETFDSTKVKQHLDEMEAEMLSSADGDMITEEMQTDLVRNDGQWQPVFDEDDADILLGHYITAHENALNSMEEITEDNTDDFAEENQITVDASVRVLHKAAWFLADTVWNKNLCDIVSCIDAGTDHNGKSYDLTAGISELDQLLSDCKAYDSKIEELDQDEYKKAVAAWKKASKVLGKLAAEIEDADPDPEDYDYSPDTDAFTKAMNAFISLAYSD